jgi:hypothetical protein
MQPQGRLGPGVAWCVCGWLGEQEAWRRAAAVGMLILLVPGSALGELLTAGCLGCLGWSACAGIRAVGMVRSGVGA